MQSRVFCLLALTCVSVYAQQWDWVQRFSGDSTGTAIGVDQSGNVYVAGSFTGTNYLGTNAFIAVGSNDVFLLKLNADGRVVWALTTGGTDNDSISQMVVTTNGTLFVIGDFTLRGPLVPESVASHSGDVSHVFVARIDEGKFTWFDTNIYPTGLTAAPDGSLWVAGYRDGIVTARLSEDGELLEQRRFQANELPGGRIVPDVNGGAFFSTTFFGKLTIGTNTLEPSYRVAQLTAGLGEEGVRWFWSAALGYESRATDVVTTPKGDVISSGYIQNNVPYRMPFIARHNADGKLSWIKYRSNWPITKFYYIPTDISVDANGNILVAGAAWPCLACFYEHAHLWLLTLDPNGNTLSEHFLRTSTDTLIPEAVTPKLAITGDSDGAIFLTGKAPGTFAFGTNTSGGGFNAFVFRRSTLQPALKTERIGTDLVLSWPRAALPFALQQSDETGTNWSFVSQAPAFVNGRWQLILPLAAAMGMFRLQQTNEPPIRHIPRWTEFYGPAQTFLGHTNAVLANSSLTFGGRCQDLDDEALAFSWIEAGTRQPIAGKPSAAHTGRYTSYGYEYPPVDQASLVQQPVTLQPGFHTIEAVASDGVFSATNSWTFEVVAAEQAVQEFFAAIEVLRGDPVGRKAMAFLDGYIRAKDRDRNKLSERRWAHFQRQLARVPSLSDKERDDLSSAADQVKSLL
jgi:hypothetical protein